MVDVEKDGGGRARLAQGVDQRDQAKAPIQGLENGYLSIFGRGSAKTAQQYRAGVNVSKTRVLSSRDDGKIPRVCSPITKISEGLGRESTKIAHEATKVDGAPSATFRIYLGLTR